MNFIDKIHHLTPLLFRLSQVLHVGEEERDEEEVKEDKVSSRLVMKMQENKQTK